MVIDRYFEETRKTAMCSEFDKVHVGCIAVYKGKIIAKGFNSEKTHPISAVWTCKTLPGLYESDPGFRNS